MPYSEKLKMIKEEKGLTNAVISKTGDVPLSTVTRIFNERTPNTSFETMVGLARGMGFSLDELAGLKKPDEQPLASPIIDTINSYAELLKEKDDRIKELKEDKCVIRKEKYKLVTVLVALVLLLVALASALVWLNIDVRNGHFGYFRY